ncbi:MAG: branched-chain amino acid ABC transporter permease [Deltaproteobacteria bacterium]|nr:MAG: branched-chain amino acid ABC transporter permease [Deltaproteobacteria bacterium]
MSVKRSSPSFPTSRSSLPWRSSSPSSPPGCSANDDRAPGDPVLGLRRAAPCRPALPAALPAHPAHPDPHLRHLRDEPRSAPRLHGPRLARACRLFRHRRLCGRDPRHAQPGLLLGVPSGGGLRRYRGRGGIRLRRHPRGGRLLPHDHARPRDGRLGTRLPLGLDDQGRQRHRGRAPARSLAVFFVAFALLWLVVRSPFGLSLQGIRETERRMRALGYDVWLHKYLAFVLAGAFAGLAGALWAYYDGFVSPVEVHLVTSVETLLMVALGGPGTLFGPILGAAVIVLFKNLLSIYTKRWLLILGVVYIGVIVLTPKGILGALRGARR